MLPPTDSISVAISSAVRRRGAFEQHLGEQLGDAVVLRGFGEHAALEHGAKFDERQAMVFLHQQAQAVGQFKFLDRLVALRFSFDCSISARCRRAAARRACGFPA